MSDPQLGGVCKKCGPLPVESFYVDRTQQRVRPYCKACEKSQRAARGWRQSKPPTVARGEEISSVPRVIAIGDVHAPFHDESWFAWMLNYIEFRRPTLVIQVGDLYDMLSFSKYPRSHNIMTPADEMEEGRAVAVDMWTDIQKRAPNARCVQLRGNHDDRLEKRLVSYLPEIESLVMPTLAALWHFPGVQTINESREEFTHNGVMYHHGHRKFGTHVTYNNQSTVNGHLHTGGVKFLQTLDGTIWELNAGCGIDVKAPVFSYGAQKRLHGATLGLGEIDEYGPRFIPYSERR